MNVFKIIAGIIATIFLGAIGSGLWERMLSPGIDVAYRGTVTFISSTYTGYLDSIYQDAAKNLPDIYQKKIALLILIILASYLLFVSFKHGNWQSPLLKRIGAIVTRQIHYHWNSNTISYTKVHYSPLIG